MTVTLLPDVSQAAEGFRAEAEDDYVGLWQVVTAARRLARDGGPTQDTALRIVGALLERGLHAGNLTAAGTFVAWPDQAPAAILARIHREWDALGHEPGINDIAWFDLARH